MDEAEEDLVVVAEAVVEMSFKGDGETNLDYAFIMNGEQLNCFASTIMCKKLLERLSENFSFDQSGL